MIISFTVRNFKSIKEESTLNFWAENIDDTHCDNIAYPDKNKSIPVLRSAGIWGANASGKSNFWNALRHLQHFVVFSHKNDLDSPIKEYVPFKLDGISCSMPTFFEIDFIGRDKEHYTYSVEFNNKKIISESLSFFASAKASNLFRRELIDDKLTIKFGAKLTGAKALSCRENPSYLSVAGNTESSSNQIKNIFRFIRDDINFISNYISVFSPNLLLNDKYLKALSTLLGCADTGISEVYSKEEAVSIDKLPKNLPETLKSRFLHDFKYQPAFKHNERLEEFSLQEESGGTQRLYNISPMILQGISEGSIWIVDEMDSLLHQYILELIIRLFHDRLINKKSPQLIFTTHCTALLNSDIFRRDQIYFTKKARSQSSERAFCI